MSHLYNYLPCIFLKGTYLKGIYRHYIIPLYIYLPYIFLRDIYRHYIDPLYIIPLYIYLKGIYHHYIDPSYITPLYIYPKGNYLKGIYHRKECFPHPAFIIGYFCWTICF